MIIICNIYTCMHIVQVVTCPSNLKNGQSNITLVGYHGQPKFTSNIVHCCDIPHIFMYIFSRNIWRAPNILLFLWLVSKMVNLGGLILYLLLCCNNVNENKGASISVAFRILLFLLSLDASIGDCYTANEFEN